MAFPEEDSRFVAYTTEWMEAINRGGLFKVSNVLYLFSRGMEGGVGALNNICLHVHSYLASPYLLISS